VAVLWDPAAVVTAASGVLMAALGALLLAARPQRDANRVFGLLAVLWGAQIVAGNAVRLTTDPDAALLAGRLALALLIPLYFLIAAFAAIFPRPRGPLGRSPAALGALALPAVAALVALFARPEALVAGVQPVGEGWTLTWGSLLPYLVTAPFFGAVSYALYAMMRRFDEAVSPTEQKQVGVVLAALGLYVGYYAPRQLVLFGGEALGWGSAREADPGEAALIAGVMAVTVAILAAVVVRGVQRVRETEPGPARDRARTLAAVVLAGVAAALLVEVVGRAGRPRLELLGVVRAGSVLLIVYGIARFQLFDLDLRAKRWAAGVGGGLAAASLAAAAYVALHGAGLGLRVAGTALVAAAAALPAFHVALRLADRVAPAVTTSGDHLHLRKLEVYRAALERRRDGAAPVNPGEPDLAELRERLGLDEADHAVVAALSEPAEAAGSSARAGEALGPYELEAVLDEGAYGRVWRAVDTRNGQRVVVKELLAKWRDDDTVAERFLREARVAGRLEHPNLVEVFGVEEHGRDRYLVMEHVPGGSLADRLEEGPLPPGEAVRAARDVLRGLAAAHEAGVVHRDVKPGNVLVDEDGRAKLTDFGIADLTRRAPEETRSGLTTTGRPPGTLAYMSPEQARGDPVGEASDLYSLGALLYRCLTGETPVDVGGLDEVSARERVTQAGPPDASELPDELAAVVRRAMAPDPEDRFESAEAFLEALEAVDLEPEPVRPA